ncbi:MAG: tRNA pseudouridine(38-40) synthase TruA [Armatimonadetes bacterium]|nr:tRNA pseudouridine(38-40) synthase TruA [Armatimonadota bacterium]
MARFRIDLEYEGTRYSGWQVQPNARTVQGELFGAVERALNVRQYDVQGSGRTDAGVHALCQTAHLEARTSLAPPLLRQRLNDALPADINVLGVDRAPQSFHARHDAVARTYLYQVSRRRTAFGKRFVWWVKDPLQTRPMQAAARFLVGLHDFRSFTAASEAQTRVKLEEARIDEDGDLILIRLTASHFLWKMVRQVVGVLVEVGRGRLPPQQIQTWLGTFSPEPAKLTAPPSGLFLERAWYPGEKRASDSRPLLRV